MSWRISTFGVRHLSPMAAWRLREVLERTRPELVLVEGLDDAADLLPDLARAETEPPVAILAYTDAQPVRTLVYPLARYSPEYQAIRWAHSHDVPVEFFDLPSDVFLGIQDREIERLESRRREAPEESTASVGVPEPRPSLYQRIAEAAGERDYETFWERRFEHEAASGFYEGAARELGSVIRDLEEEDSNWRAENLVREAYMRRRVEQAIASGVRPERIVAVVGAYHDSAIHGGLPAMTDDELARLPRRSSRLTLMPYSYFRLSSQSGYGAGNHAPAYFELLWQALNQRGLVDLSRRYLSLVARCLRDAGIPRSTAEVIDAVRLAETLSALKDGQAPALADLHDAAVTLLGQGEPVVVREALVKVDVGAAVGRLPRGVSQTSIQADFDRELRRLKLEKYRVATQQTLELDLRENRRVQTEEAAFLDLHRSAFLHRLRVLGISFARPAPPRQDSATWAERWLLQWTPEGEIELVEAVLLGETVELAAAYRFKARLEARGSIAEAAALVRDACLCGLMKSMDLARRRLQELAATSAEFTALAAAAWDLGQVVRYGDVRRFDSAPLLPLLEELFVNAALALHAAAGCDDKAVKATLRAVDEVDLVSLAFHDRVEGPLWIERLQRLADADDRNPVLSGFACAILLERGLMENEALAREVSRRLSPGVPADLGAGWFEGLALRNRYALLARQSLWEQLAGYVESLDETQFRRALVFLRRAFGPFSAREKRRIAENLGEYWGLNADAASDLIERPLTVDEEKSLSDLNEFDFDL